jgi:L-asparaginase II
MAASPSGLLDAAKFPHRDGARMCSAHSRQSPHVAGIDSVLAPGCAHAAFFDHAEHHPFGDTLKPANNVQAPVAAVKNWQLAHVLPDL